MIINLIRVLYDYGIIFLDKLINPEYETPPRPPRLTRQRAIDPGDNMVEIKSPPQIIRKRAYFDDNKRI